MAWQRRIYRGNKAWVRVAKQGALDLDERGLSRLRYKLADARDYTVRPEDLSRLPPVNPPHAELRAYVAVARDEAPGLGLVLRQGPHQAEAAGRIPEPAPEGREVWETAYRFIRFALRRPDEAVAVVSSAPAPAALPAGLLGWRDAEGEAEAALLERAQRIADEARRAAAID